MQYFQKIESTSQLALFRKEDMRQLNEMRNDLKHEGRLPSKLHIDEIRSNVLEFFRRNTSLVFGLDFDSLSLIEFVECSIAKELLLKAQEELKDGKSTDSANNISVAFDYLIYDYLNEIYGYDFNPTKNLKKEEEKVNYFNINYSDYLRFRSLVSPPMRLLGSELGKPTNTRLYTNGEIQLCLNFTIESAMKIQKYLHSNVYD